MESRTGDRGSASGRPSPSPHRRERGRPPRPGGLARILEELPAEVVDRFSGCGSPIPEAIEGRRLLDLGCGTGRDVVPVRRPGRAPAGS